MSQKSVTKEQYIAECKRLEIFRKDAKRLKEENGNQEKLDHANEKVRKSFAIIVKYMNRPL